MADAAYLVMYFFVKRELKGMLKYKGKNLDPPSVSATDVTDIAWNVKFIEYCYIIL